MQVSWTMQSLCRTYDPEVFFPSGPGDGWYNKPRTICGQCPVQNACLEAELSVMLRDPEAGTYGMFGGTTPNERRRLIAGMTARRRGQLVAA
jgi:hypothetical protein